MFPIFHCCGECRQLMDLWPLMPLLNLYVNRPPLSLFYYYMYIPSFPLHYFVRAFLHVLSNCNSVWKTVWSRFGFIMALVVGINNLVKVFNLGFYPSQSARVECFIGLDSLCNQNYCAAEGKKSQGKLICSSCNMLSFLYCN